jgi:WD40 repeat protein
MFMRSIVVLLPAWFVVSLIAACGEQEAQVEIDEQAKDAFASIDGKLGITLESRNDEHRVYRYVLKAGELTVVSSLPGAPDGSTGGPPVPYKYKLPTQDRYDYRSPYVVSPDGKFLAVSASKKTTWFGSSTALAVFSAETNKLVLLTEGDSARYIASLAWSPDSTFVAMLRISFRSGKMPMEILSSMAGHPINYSTYYLEIVDLTGKVIASSKLVSDLRLSSDEIVWLPDP